MGVRLSLHGKLAVITGGGRGIGLAVARVFVREGCNLIITGRHGQTLQIALAELNKTGSGEVTALGCDIAKPADIETLFAAVAKKYHTIDVLVNNAGIAHGLGPVDQLELETWQRVINTNLTGMFLTTRAALPMMKIAGTIVNNLSMAAVQPFAGMAAYCASKYGALGFTNALRMDLRQRGIRVLALIPGATDTAIWNEFWPQAPREKMMSSDTVAEAVLHAVTLPPEATMEEIRIGPAAGAL
ncbi:MAG TPA: SDR family NAD(P)-dependent oxidoreductase [Candidatus Saccharimonadales bacterium]|jgi:NAD(P)-dependent dehydrogenase (short-subunit alcohol dehydrogenase family)|nr:SDR family NAD(P)-dependent oxidoreductase [Candidatus Saccharimonadales bacterium]